MAFRAFTWAVIALETPTRLTARRAQEDFVSVSQWWISFLIDEAEHARLLPSFRPAIEVPVPDEGQRAIELWRSNPESFERRGAHLVSS